MTDDEVREHMDACRRSADEEALRFKESSLVGERLRSMYEKFDMTERRAADEVIGEWALSNDEALRFDALSLIDEFAVTTAVPALIGLASRLATSTAPGAPFEILKVKRIIESLRRLRDHRG